MEKVIRKLGYDLQRLWNLWKEEAIMVLHWKNDNVIWMDMEDCIGNFFLVNDCIGKLSWLFYGCCGSSNY